MQAYLASSSVTKKRVSTSATVVSGIKLQLLSLDKISVSLARPLSRVRVNQRTHFPPNVNDFAARVEPAGRGGGVAESPLTLAEIRAVGLP
jgi:hypothetical protein